MSWRPKNGQKFEDPVLLRFFSRNKLECLALESIYHLVQYLQGLSNKVRVGSLFKDYKTTLETFAKAKTLYLTMCQSLKYHTKKFCNRGPSCSSYSDDLKWIIMKVREMIACFNYFYDFGMLIRFKCFKYFKPKF